MASNLSTLLESKGVNFGTTPEGKEWCIKALHPADSRFTSRGIPDRSCARTFTYDYEMEFVLSNPRSLIKDYNCDSWGVDCQLLPHPIVFMSGFYTDQDEWLRRSGAPARFEVFNPHIISGSHDHAQNYLKFSEHVEKWRLMYSSVTITLVCNDTSNQGTMSVCQRPLCPLSFNASGTKRGTAEGVDTIVLLPKILCYPGKVNTVSGEHPQYGRIANMPNMFTGAAKDGAYIPLKLDETMEKWTSRSDDCSWAFRPDGDAICPILGAEPKLLDAESPFPTLNAAYFSSATGRGMIGSITTPLCTANVADIGIKGLSPSASIRMIFRCGYEFQCSPGSPFVPLLKPAPNYDRQAIDSYYAVTRELKDAYPASFNELSKLWGPILSAVREIVPVVSPFLGGLGKVIFGGVGTKHKRNHKKKPTTTNPEQLPAVELQREQDKLKEALTAPPFHPKKKQAQK